MVTASRHHVWLFPNLTEDVGFWASFWPLYQVLLDFCCVFSKLLLFHLQHEYHDGSSSKDKKKKRKKDKDSDAEDDSPITPECGSSTIENIKESDCGKGADDAEEQPNQDKTSNVTGDNTTAINKESQSSKP